MSDSTQYWGDILEPFNSDEVLGVIINGTTDDAWSLILEMCRRELHIGFGPLDAFLFGEDLEHRINLLEKEVRANKWLREELRDTVAMNQSETLSPEQIAQLKRATDV
ncbi:MAG: hypothetical protein ABL890_04805 [Candidatus Peribacteraceae bacterium]